MNILIVEDTPKERDLYEEQFASLGHEVTLCADANTALTTCQQTFFSLIVLDLGLPDMDGVELCRCIRELPQGEQCMILVVTGRDNPDDLHNALEAGANDYLSKPVSLGQLKVRLFIIEQQLQHLIARKEAEEAHMESLIHIAQAKQEWESTADSLSDIICLLDCHGTIMRANRTIEQWKLGKVETIKGQDVHSVFHPDCRTANCYLTALLEQAKDQLSQGKAVEHEVEDKCLRRWLNIQIRPVASQTGHYPEYARNCAVFVATDVSIQKQLQNSLIRLDKLLLGVAGAMDHLLMNTDLSSAVPRALRTLGLAADADRVYIYKNHPDPKTGDMLMSQLFEWNRFTRETQIKSPTLQNIAYNIGFNRWYDVLSQNDTISGSVKDLEPIEQDLLAAQNIMSILLVPIFIDGDFWGFIGFDDCHSAREWRDEEEAVLMAMAGSIGGAVAREQAEMKLRQTSEELRAVFQSLPDEYFRLGADGSILDYKINEGADLLQSDTFIGKWASGLLPEHIETQFNNAITHVQNKKTPVSTEYKSHQAETGQDGYEEIRLLPFLEDQIIVVVRDMTERKHAELELKAHRDQLEKRLQKAADQLKQETARRKQAEARVQKLQHLMDPARVANPARAQQQ